MPTDFRRDGWIAHGVTKNWTRLRDFTFTFMYGCESWTLKKAEPQIIGSFELCCISIRLLPWRRKLQSTSVFLPGESPWTKEPGRLQSMGSQELDMT